MELGSEVRFNSTNYQGDKYLTKTSTCLPATNRTAFRGSCIFHELGEEIAQDVQTTKYSWMPTA